MQPPPRTIANSSRTSRALPAPAGAGAELGQGCGRPPGLGQPPALACITIPLSLSLCSPVISGSR